jgi:hypothetical protein
MRLNAVFVFNFADCSGLHFLALVSFCNTDITNLWETEFCCLQDLDKHATVSDPQNRIWNFRR